MPLEPRGQPLPLCFANLEIDRVYRFVRFDLDCIVDPFLRSSLLVPSFNLGWASTEFATAFVRKARELNRLRYKYCRVHLDLRNRDLHV